MNPLSNNPSRRDKKHERAESERQLREYLARGGTITVLDTKISDPLDEDWQSVSKRLYKANFGKEKPSGR